MKQMIKEATWMTLMIDNRQDKYDVKEIEEVVKSVVNKSIEYENIKKDCQVSVIFVDNDQIRDINREYRNIDSSTDVLSFPMLEYDEGRCPGDVINDALDIDIDTGELVLGDIAISLERAYEQSIDYGHSFKREVAYLTVHGMMHLFGYDHEEDEDKRIMREREEGVLKLLSIER